MKINTETLLDLLYEKNDWVESSYLSDHFGVSSRTIRNYVNKINSSNEEQMILSSYKGYRINENLYNKTKYDTKEYSFDTPSQRSNYIVRKLLTSSVPLNIFELAEELYVSEPTIESDLKRARNFIRYFNLHILRDKEQLTMEGSERDKRKVISYLINLENYNDFMSFTDFGFVSNNYQAEQLSREISEIFKKNDLYVNDYGLNNIMLHLIVTIERIMEKRNISEEVNLDKVDKTKDYTVAKEIKFLIENKYKITISDSELYYLTLTISSNSSVLDLSFVNSNNISEYIEEKYINITKNAIRKVEETYFLDTFSEDFLVKFTIHVRSLFKRITNNAYVKNPLVSRIKTTYPLIYDIAVFIANEFKDKENVFVNEDEIAFIAFHIGAYLENNKNYENKVTCIFVYADYYSMHQMAIDKISKTFENDLEIITAISVKDIKNKNITADLILSTVDTILDTNSPIININVFITDDDIIKIQNQVNKIKINKKSINMANHLTRFVSKKLLKKEFYKNDEFEMIEALTTECYELGLTDKSFKDEVLERESLSSTSFGNCVAVPHSLKQSAYHSFMSFVINEKKMQWGNHLVNIIVLIGINREDRTSFREIFDDLINILSEPTNIPQLLKCEDYNDFIETMSSMMIKE